MNKIKEFFDKQAPTWNDEEDITQKRLESLLAPLPMKAGDKVMDLGCGTGIISDILYQKSKRKVYGVDLSDKMIEIARATHDENHIEYCASDIMEYDKNCDFNCIVLYNAYPHFLNPEKLAFKIDSLLCDGGYFIILHSMGRATLDKHHEAFAHEVSRHLKSPMEEYAFFKERFDLVESFEDDSRYLLILKKKSF